MTISEILDLHHARIEASYNALIDNIQLCARTIPNFSDTPEAAAMWAQSDDLIDSLCVAEHYIDCHGSESIGQ